jgi:hypothetical protein
VSAGQRDDPVLQVVETTGRTDATPTMIEGIVSAVVPVEKETVT